MGYVAHSLAGCFKSLSLVGRSLRLAFKETGDEALRDFYLMAETRL